MDNSCLDLSIQPHLGKSQVLASSQEIKNSPFKTLPLEVALIILLQTRQWSSFVLEKGLSFREAVRIFASSKDKSIIQHIAFCVDKFVSSKTPLEKVMNIEQLSLIKFEKTLLAFLTACKNGHLEVIKILVEKYKIDPSVFMNEGIFSACENNQVEVVKFLLKDPRVDPATDENKAIRRASQMGEVEIVITLLGDKRVNPAALGNQALRWAKRHKHDQVVEVLLTDERVKSTYQSDPTEL